MYDWQTWNWASYVPLQDTRLIEEYEALIDYRFPEEFKQLAMMFDSGRARDRRVVVLENGEKETFNDFESFKKDDPASIWWTWEETDFDEAVAKRYVHFAMDSFGNLYCFDRADDSIVFLDHEDESVVKAAKDFSDFMGRIKER